MKNIDRKLAQRIILNNKYSPYPDRPMHPDAKMTGGDKPCWDADMSYWITCGDNVKKIKGYIDSSTDRKGCKVFNCVVSGEINNKTSNKQGKMDSGR